MTTLARYAATPRDEDLSSAVAAFVNSVMFRFPDYNDGYMSAGESGHPELVLVSPLHSWGPPAGRCDAPLQYPPKQEKLPAEQG